MADPTTTSQTSETPYDDSSIGVLKGLEGVRKRPGMYIGDTDDGTGLHHLVHEVVDNSVDEHLAGHCTRIDVIVHYDNSVTVDDNGRGIPVDIMATENRPAAEVVMTVLHAGGKFGGSGYKVSGGLHGVGVSAVNALAASTIVEVHRDGKIHTQLYERGKPTSPVRTVAKAQLPPPPVLPWREQSRLTGTVTRFAPDPQMFPVIEWDTGVITQWLRETAYLNKGLWLALHDERNATAESYYFASGVISFVRHLNRSHENLHPKPIYSER